jgi:hypothetical protein
MQSGTDCAADSYKQRHLFPDKYKLFGWVVQTSFSFYQVAGKLLGQVVFPLLFRGHKRTLTSSKLLPLLFNLLTYSSRHSTKFRSSLPSFRDSRWVNFSTINTHSPTCECNVFPCSITHYEPRHVSRLATRLQHCTALHYTVNTTQEVIQATLFT